jgi:hypothetical protein
VLVFLLVIIGLTVFVLVVLVVALLLLAIAIFIVALLALRVARHCERSLQSWKRLVLLELKRRSA